MGFSPCLSFSESKTEVERREGLTGVTHHIGGRVNTRPKWWDCPRGARRRLRALSPPRGGWPRSPLPGSFLGLSQRRGLETQPVPRSLSTSSNGRKGLRGCIRLPGLPPANALCGTLHDSLQGQPMCVCRSGPLHSPLLTHPSPLFHQQTLGLERQSNWLAVSYSQLPSLSKHTALFVLSAQPPGPHCRPDPCSVSDSPPSCSHRIPARAGEAHGKLLGQPLTAYPSNTASTLTDETTQEVREWLEVTAQEDRASF